MPLRRLLTASHLVSQSRQHRTVIHHSASLCPKATRTSSAPPALHATRTSCLFSLASLLGMSAAPPPAATLQAISAAIIPLSVLQRGNYQQLVDAIGQSRLVLIGEATHGTEEFYRIRADISKRLIEKEGFDFVAVEGDWPDCYRVNLYIHHKPQPLQAQQKPDESAEEALGDFTRFPRWMWRNEAVRDYAEWCKDFNRRVPAQQSPGRLPVGWFGMDLYSLFTSADAVIAFLESVDKQAAEKARERYGTLGQFRHEPAEYGVAVHLGIVESQETKCRRMLVDLFKRAPKMLKERGFVDQDELFYTQLNALLVKDAEEYYRNSMAGGNVTWNIRDKHMVSTVSHLLQYYDQQRAAAGLKGPSRAILWAHNSHLGDARHTVVSRAGEWNVGQLVREQWGMEQSFNVGFTTYDGTVSAARRWGAERETMTVNPGLAGSYEDVMHRVATLPSHPQQLRDTDESKESNQQPQPQSQESDFALLFRSNGAAQADTAAVQHLSTERLERAIGVQYVRSSERQSHYMQCTLSNQFDAVIHVDRSNALVSTRRKHTVPLD